MTDTFARISMHGTTLGGSLDNEVIITGYVDKFEPEEPAKRDVLRPVEPDEPDTKIEVGYSKNALEPLVIEFQGRKVKLTDSIYPLFRYINDLYRAEGKTEFEFSELSEVLTGDECDLSRSAIISLIRRLALFLEKIRSPLILTCKKEVLYVSCKNATGK